MPVMCSAKQVACAAGGDFSDFADPLNPEPDPLPEHRRAVVFDLDGTLVDTAADIHAILAEVLVEAGLPAPGLAAVRAMIGDGARVLIERALATIGQPTDAATIDRFLRRFTERYAELPCRHSVPLKR